MKTGWIAGGWLFSMAASALPALWTAADRIERNPLGKFVNVETGHWRLHLYLSFLQWWLPIAAPVSMLALACMLLNRPREPD
ncbi:MAG: hypothetical protein P0Y56_05055 [Candidatus Andeanibacterium colombiense]|uniref:Uncharacterized protein n=1 Tax=Candidatus Andeanibacterium colombiense TaxID=3121345 RepID=A0AAJ6BNS1_9SPHN|nr:MAG: hypothetical protein P0Y56_05055 [Sphingomonadaceae bacterium]